MFYNQDVPVEQSFIKFNWASTRSSIKFDKWLIKYFSVLLSIVNIPQNANKYHKYR